MAHITYIKYAYLVLSVPFMCKDLIPLLMRGLLLRAVTWGKAAKASQVRCFAAAAACLWSKHGGNFLRLLSVASLQTDIDGIFIRGRGGLGG